MPLKPGSSRQVISTNIREMRASGRPQNQAIAAALRLARQGKAAGGEVTAEAPDTFRGRFAGKMQDQHPQESVYDKLPASNLIEDRRGEIPDPELTQRMEADTARQMAAHRMRMRYFGQGDLPRRAFGGDVGSSQTGGSTGGKGSMGSLLSGGQSDQIMSRFLSNLQSGGNPWTAAYSAAQPSGSAPMNAAPPSGVTPPPSASVPPPSSALPPAPAPAPQQGGLAPTCPGYAEGGEVDDPTPSGGDPWAPLMDPFERSAYKVRKRYGTEVPGPPDLATPQEHIDAGLMLMGPVGAAIQDPRGTLNMVAPGLTGDRRSAGEVMSAATGSKMSMGAPGESPQDIMARQQKLKEGNFYNGEIDGKDGLATQAAQRAFEAAEKMRLAAEANELATKKVDTDKETAAAKKLEAQNETRRLALLEQARLAKEKGNERYQEMEREVPLMSQIKRDYATPAGIVLGGGIGAALRTGLGKGANLYNRMRAGKAESLFGETAGAPVTAANMGTRSQKVNQFWRTGGAGPKEVPYTETPTQSPGIAFNENPKNIGELYPKPDKYINPGTVTDASIMAGAAGESLLGQFKLQPDAQQRVKEALERVKEEPSEANLRELQAAKDNDAVIRMITNVGRGGVGGYGTAAKIVKRTPVTPAMDVAGSERLAVDAALRAANDRAQKTAARSQKAALPASPALEAIPTAAPASTAASPPMPTAAASTTAKRARKSTSAKATSQSPFEMPNIPGQHPLPPNKFAEGGEVGGGLGDADEIASLRAAIEEENQRTQRAGIGLRYKREYENENRASPFVNQIERSGNRIEGLSDRLEALLPNPLLGPYPKEEPPHAPQGPEAPPPREAIVDAPGRQRDYWDLAKKAMFGNPDAMVDTRLKALNHPPSSWSPDERDYIAGGVTEAGVVASPSSLILRGPAAARAALTAGRPPGNPTGSMLNASRMGGPPSPRGSAPGPSAPSAPPARPGPGAAPEPGPVPTGPWNPAPNSALGPAAGRNVRGTMIPVERVNGRYQSLSGATKPPRDPNAMPAQRRLPGAGRMDKPWEGFSSGGLTQSPWFSRDEARHMDDKITGPLAGTGGGRTDRLPISVPSGSYVVPADIVSGLGQGNTANGMKAMQKMFFQSGPYGTPLMRGARGRGPPRAPAPMKFADGGGVPIMAADGEFIVPPEKVIEIGGGDMDHGHNVLDHFVKLMRQQTIKTLSSLPDPQV